MRASWTHQNGQLLMKRPLALVVVFLHLHTILVKPRRHQKSNWQENNTRKLEEEDDLTITTLTDTFQK
jgi:hypothetical protein